jgi:type IV pilus assembly protein PilZ
VDLRRHARVPVDATTVTFTLKGSSQPLTGVAKDISVGGMFVVVEEPPPFNAEVIVRIILPEQLEELVLPGVVRWTRDDGMGVQFGLLGVRETHAITEFVANRQK